MTSETDYKKLLQGMKLRRSYLAAELAALESTINGLEQLSKIALATQPPLFREPTGESSLLGLRPQDAALAQLRSIGRTASALEVTQELERRGYKSGSEKLYPVIYTALRRLVEKKLVRKSEAGFAVAE